MLSVGRKKSNKIAKENLFQTNDNFMSTPDIPLHERFGRFQKSLKYLRTVTQGIRQTDELERALEAVLVRYSREGRNG